MTTERTGLSFTRQNHATPREAMAAFWGVTPDDLPDDLALDSPDGKHLTVGLAIEALEHVGSFAFIRPSAGQDWTGELVAHAWFAEGTTLAAKACAFAAAIWGVMADQETPAAAREASIGVIAAAVGLATEEG